jgi:hypothetical protein
MQADRRRVELHQRGRLRADRRIKRRVGQLRDRGLERRLLFGASRQLLHEVRHLPTTTPRVTMLCVAWHVLCDAFGVFGTSILENIGLFHSSSSSADIFKRIVRQSKND